MNNFIFILLFPILFLLTIYYNFKFNYLPIDKFIIYNDKNEIIKEYNYFPNIIYYFYSFNMKNLNYKLIYCYDNL